jgi:hypothetical protein
MLIVQGLYIKAKTVKSEDGRVIQCNIIEKRMQCYDDVKETLCNKMKKYYLAGIEA